MHTSRPGLTYLLTLAATLAGTNAVAQALATTPTKPAAAADTSGPNVTDTVMTIVDVTRKQGKVLQPLLKSEIAKAVAQGRTPFVEVGATWCGPCNKIKASLGDRRMIKAFSGTYIVRLDADEWSRSERLQLGLASGYLPTFFAIDSTGKATANLQPEASVAPETFAEPLRQFFQAHAWKKR